MFYFIGVGRFTKNIYEIISTGQRLDELFEEIPENFKKYEDKVKNSFLIVKHLKDKQFHGQC